MLPSDLAVTLLFTGVACYTAFLSLTMILPFDPQSALNWKRPVLQFAAKPLIRLRRPRASPGIESRPHHPGPFHAANEWLGRRAQAAQHLPDAPILLNTMHSAVIRSEAILPEGITAVVDKRENLLRRVFQLLPWPNGAQRDAGL